MGTLHPDRLARHEPPWVGPVAHSHLKLPRLSRLVNSFDARGRRVILHSTLADVHLPSNGSSELEDQRAAGDAPTARVASVGAAVIISSGTQLEPMFTAGDLVDWTQTADGVWAWAQARAGDLAMPTLSVRPQLGPDGDMLVAHIGSQLTESDHDLIRGLVAQGSGVGSDVDLRPDLAPSTPPPTSALGDVAGAVDRLRRRPLLAVTGAGISSASGVLPFFGPNGLDENLGLVEPYPGRLVESILAAPERVLDVLAGWHLSFLSAEPTLAHHALVDLEQRGHLAGVFTTNIDRLHQAAGARRVAETEQLLRARPPAEAGVVVVGSANDPSDVIERARAIGATVVIVDRRVPDWAQPQDLVVLGDPQTIVPELADHIAGLRTPLTVVGQRSADAWLPTLPESRIDVPWSELASLADLARHRSPARRSTVHGPRHWLSVAWIGAHLAATDPEVDPLVVGLFALFHDCQRHHDGHDLEHGERGAFEAQALLETVDWVHPDQHHRLAEACRWHTHGEVSDDPTIGACWDADRLDLWRVGATPLVRLLSRPGSGDLAPWSRHLLDVGDDDVAWDDWNPVARAYAAVLAAR